MGEGIYRVIGSPLGKRNSRGGRNEWRALYVLWLSTHLAKVMLRACYCYPHFPFCTSVAMVLHVLWLFPRHFNKNLIQYVQYISSYETFYC